MLLHLVLGMVVLLRERRRLLDRRVDLLEWVLSPVLGREEGRVRQFVEAEGDRQLRGLSLACGGERQRRI